MDELDPREVGDMLAQYSGDVLGRFALGDESVTYGDLYEAVSVSWIGMQETAEGVFSPENHRIVELIITP